MASWVARQAEVSALGSVRNPTSVNKVDSGQGRHMMLTSGLHAQYNCTCVLIYIYIYMSIYIYAHTHTYTHTITLYTRKLHYLLLISENVIHIV